MFAELSPQEQWYLHDYFRFSEELSEPELLAHRKAISRRRPSLPQSAGRALGLLVRMLQAYVAPQPVVQRKPGERLPTVKVTNVTARAVVKPKPDARKLAQAIWQTVLKEHEKDHRLRP